MQINCNPRGILLIRHHFLFTPRNDKHPNMDKRNYCIYRRFSGGSIIPLPTLSCFFLHRIDNRLPRLISSGRISKQLGGRSNSRGGVVHRGHMVSNRFHLNHLWCYHFKVSTSVNHHLILNHWKFLHGFII